MDAVLQPCFLFIHFNSQSVNRNALVLPVYLEHESVTVLKYAMKLNIWLLMRETLMFEFNSQKYSKPMKFKAKKAFFCGPPIQKKLFFMNRKPRYVLQVICFIRSAQPFRSTVPHNINISFK